MSEAIQHRPNARRATARTLRLGLGAATVVVLVALAAGLISRWLPMKEPMAGVPGEKDETKAGRAERLNATVFPVRAHRPDAVDPKRERIEYGSGVAVHRKGIILTAAHVARPDGRDARVVVLVGERELSAVVARTKVGVDVAVLSVPDYDGPFLRLIENEPKRDAAVSVAGFPVKYSGTALPKLIVTDGTIDDPAYSSPLKELHTRKVLRITGPTDLGGSGGAVVDSAGDLVGLVFGSRVVKNEVTHTYAIPAAELKPLVAKKP